MTDRRGWGKQAAAVAGAFLLLLLLYQLRTLVLLLLVAFLLAYVLDPAVSRMAKILGGRGRAIAVVALILCAALAISAILLGPRIADEFRWAAATLPDKATRTYTQIVVHLKERFGLELPPTLPQAAVELWGLRSGWGPWLTQQTQGILAGAASSVAGLVTTVLDLLIVPAFWVFFLQEGPELKARVLRQLPSGRRAWTERVVKEMDGALRESLRGQATVCAVVACLLGLGLALVGMELAIVMAIVSGLATFIPYFGPLLSGLTAMLLAMLQFGDLRHGFETGIVYVVVYAVEAFVITPRIVGHRIGLHPLAVLIVVLASAQLFGPWGLLFAVPVAAVLRVLIPEVWALLRQEQLHG